MLLTLVPLTMTACFFNGNGQLQGEAKDNGNGNSPLSGNASNNGNGNGKPKVATGPSSGAPSVPSAASGSDGGAEAAPADPPAIARAKAQCAAASGSADDYRTSADAIAKAQGTWFICSGSLSGSAGVAFADNHLTWLGWDGVGLSPAPGSTPLDLTASDLFVPPLGKTFSPASGFAFASADGASSAHTGVLTFETNPVRLTVFDLNDFEILLEAVPFPQ